MTEAILTFNAGSSSVKFAVFDTAQLTGAALLRGQLDGIGTQPRFTARDDRNTAIDPPAGMILTAPGLAAGLPAWTTARGIKVAAVGHRVVHGGPTHDSPAAVTSGLLAALDALTPLAPLHQSQSLAPIRAFATAWPGLRQVACFDTAFHHTLPPVATWFGLPHVLRTAGVRRYGFHGLSYEHVAEQLETLAPQLAAGRVVAAHLGSGASLCALREGRSIDVTTGMTALDGLVMATRCGALDPGAVLYLLQSRGMSAAQITDLLYHRAGLLGVSGLTGDIRDLLASSDPQAREAVELFVFRIIRETAALASSLGGLDGVVFTGGIGEHAAPVRAAICAGLAWLGVTLDDAANQLGAKVISAPTSRVEVRIIPADEEAIIARQTQAVIQAARPAAIPVAKIAL